MNIKKLAQEQAKYRLGSLWDQKIDAETDHCDIITVQKPGLLQEKFWWGQCLDELFEIDKSLKIPCSTGDNSISQFAQTSGKVNTYQFANYRSVGDLNMGILNNSRYPDNSYNPNKKELYNWKRIPYYDMDWEPYKTPFEEKKPIIFWRGNTTGGGYKDYDMKRLADMGYTKEQRKILGRRSHFCEYFNKNPHKNVDIKPIAPDGKTLPGRVPRITRRDYIELAYREYKYLLYIEGNDLGSNEWWTYKPNCVVFRQEVTRVVTPYDLYIKPWKHYIPYDPIAPEDIIDKIHWCEKNQDKCLDIIKRANNVYNIILNPELRYETYKIMAGKIKNNLII